MPSKNSIKEKEDLKNQILENAEIEDNTETKKTTNPIENIEKNSEILPQLNTNKTEISLNNSKKTLSTLSIFGILVSIFFIILIIAFLIFSFSNSKNENIFSGIYIKNVDVSNLSTKDARTKINNYLINSLPEEIILKHGDYETSINISDLNIQFELDEAINLAHDIGRNGNFLGDNFEVLSTIFFNKNIEPSFVLDKSSLKTILEDISTKLPDKVIESSYYIEDNNLIITKGKSGQVIDIDAMISVIENGIKNLNVKNNKIEIITKYKKPEEVNLDSIYNEIHKEAVDAYFTSDPLAVFPSENGIDFDISIDEAKSLLEESDNECTIPLKTLYPNVTTNMIGQEAFPDKLSEFSTRYVASNVNRTTNLRLAANKINGTVIMPGEEFSYNKVVGERTIAAGYKEAPIYVSGRVEDGLGGGICQITTTLYNAAVLANLEITERTNHQFVPSYAGASRDATVVYGAIDFKFKNNRDYPIKIMCSVASGIANFQIYGLKTDSDYEVEIYSRITNQTSTSINSEAYKILKQNGNIVEQVLLSKDTYKRH